MTSLTTCTRFLKNVTRETSALFQESVKNGCDIPTVELREASLDETDLVHFIQYFGDQFPTFIYDIDGQNEGHSNQDEWIKTNNYYLLTKELCKPYTDPIDKMELLVRVYKFGNADEKSEEIIQKQQRLNQVIQDISKLENDLVRITEIDGKSLIGSDIALLKEEAELDRLELQISKLKSGNIY